MESGGGEDTPLRAPETSSGSLEVILSASDLLDAVSNAANLEPERALFNSVSGQLICDSNLAGGERVPDVGEVMCPGESSVLTDEDDEDDGVDDE